MTEIKLQRRSDLVEGYILSPVGACVSDAIRTADISIPSYREALLANGNIILTSYNSNSRVKELITQPPSLEVCQQALAAIAERQDRAVEELQALLADAETEMAEASNSQERGFWRSRARSIERKLEQIAAEAEITAKELHHAFVREDVMQRARAVPPEMREALEAIEAERRLASLA